MFGRAGIDPATVVLIGALFGPSQVGARLFEFIFASNVHPLNIARFALAMLLAGFALLALFGFWVPVAMVFAIMFGAANGLITITRGAVPLALFGAAGYGRLLGRIAKPFQIMQALAPVVLAFVVEHFGSGRIGAGGGVHRARMCCMAAIRRPRRTKLPR